MRNNTEQKFCPYCGETIEDPKSPNDELVCPNCQQVFHLDDAITPTDITFLLMAIDATLKGDEQRSQQAKQ